MTPLSTSRPPGPRFRFSGAAALRTGRDPLSALTGLARRYGDVASFSSGLRPGVLVSHPDLIKEVLVTRAQDFGKSRALEGTKLLLGNGLLTSEGSFHARQRRLVQPAFHLQHFRAYADIMAEEAGRMAAQWQPGRPLDMVREMSDLTLLIVARTLFGAEYGRREASLIHDALTTSLSLFPLTLLPFGRHLERLPFPQTFRFRRAKQRLDDVIYALIAERRAHGVAHRQDVLSLLLAAQDTESGSQGGGMSDEQLRDEAMILFLAGHETTANALSWTWHLLASHPDVEQRLAAEAASLPGPSGRSLDFDDVARLPYTRAVLQESMRLYPPAWIQGRRALFDLELAGYLIPRNSTVLVSQWVVHRDPRFFPDPDRFDPVRWEGDAPASRPRFSYFPFGAGPRVCIGEHFAMTEMILVLATLLRRWSLQRSPDAPPVTPWPTITLRPRPSVLMVPTERR